MIFRNDPLQLSELPAREAVEYSAFVAAASEKIEVRENIGYGGNKSAFLYVMALQVCVLGGVLSGGWLLVALLSGASFSSVFISAAIFAGCVWGFRWARRNFYHKTRLRVVAVLNGELVSAVSGNLWANQSPSKLWLVWSIPVNDLGRIEIGDAKNHLPYKIDGIADIFTTWRGRRAVLFRLRNHQESALSGLQYEAQAMIARHIGPPETSKDAAPAAPSQGFAL